MDKVKFNLKNVHFAPMKMSGIVPEYENPIKVQGAVAFSLDPQGDVTPFYADGITYYQSCENNGYTGDLEMALFPSTILKAIWQMSEGEVSKVLTEDANKETKAFALLFEEDGDTSGTKFVLYNCTGTRPKRTYATNTEKKDPTTQTSTITAVPLENGLVLAMTQEDTPLEIKENWYKKVFIEGVTDVTAQSETKEE